MQQNRFLTGLAEQADKTFHEAVTALENALADQQRDISQAVAVKGHLGDGYWKQAHAARLRYLAVEALCDALRGIPE